MRPVIRKMDDGKIRDYTMKLEGSDGSDLNCPLREVAVAMNPTGKNDILPQPICSDDCVGWHIGCPFTGSSMLSKIGLLEAETESDQFGE